MPVIATTLGVIRDSVDSVAQAGFISTAGALGNLITAGSVILLIVMGLNLLMQVRPMTSASFFAFGWKIVLIGMAAQSWDNFAVIYNILADVPQNLGARTMEITGSTNDTGLYAALDELLLRITQYGETTADEAGWFLGGILTAMFFLLSGVFAAVAAGIIAYGLIMFTVMIIIAPAMIVSALFPPTKDIFAAWSRATIGYAMIPLVAGGVLGAVVTIGNEVLDTAPAPGDATSLALILPFVVVALLSLGVMSSVPSIAGNISGMIGLASNAGSLNAMANRGISSASSGAMRALSSVVPAARAASVALAGVGAAGAAAGAATGAGGGSSGTPQHRAKYSPGEMIVRMQRLKNG